jgi:ubiquinone/menaquinone biosynthesis C-methylase UbiE
MKTADKMWNLTADQWSSVLQSKADAADVAARLERTGPFVPWSQILVDETADCVSTVDLGCGRGEHSAILARAGRETVLVDWSDENLGFCRGMYEALGLRGEFCRADITKPLPLDSNSADMVFSCGVFEYFNASQIDAIMAEAFRVARKRVIIMVPNAQAVAYRLGKWYSERSGAWEWGGEVPSHTLKHHFKRAGAVRVREFSVGTRHALDFLAPLPGGRLLARFLIRALRLTRHPRPSSLRQGYLLVTIGEKPSS